MSNSAEEESAVRRRAWVPLDQCPMALAAEVVGDRWVLLILREAAYGVVRYDDILQDLGAPRSVLTNRLKRMLESGLLEKRPYREPGARTRSSYVLTHKGRDLMLVLIALTQWGETHLLGSPGPVEIRSHTDNRRLRVELVDSADQSVPINQAVLTRQDDHRP